jgi:hypothetical protein
MPARSAPRTSPGIDCNRLRMRLMSSAACLIQHWWRGVARFVRSRHRYREEDREAADRQLVTLKLIRELYLAGQELKKFYTHNKVSARESALGRIRGERRARWP